MKQLKPLLMISASHTRVPVQVAATPLPIQCAANVLGWWSKSLGPLSPMWEAWIEFLAPHFGLSLAVLNIWGVG